MKVSGQSVPLTALWGSWKSRTPPTLALGDGDPPRDLKDSCHQMEDAREMFCADSSTKKRDIFSSKKKSEVLAQGD